MPFTISHAAAALPVHALSKARLPLAALMVGSMAPDFAYFLPWDFVRVETHGLIGLFAFCLPVGLPAWLFYVLLLERPTLAFLPESWRTRVHPSGPLNPRALLMGCVAIVIGAITHLVWDAFTHASTPVVNALPGFRSALLEVDGVYVPLYFALQVVSSVIGLVALLVWASRIRRRVRLPHEAQVARMMPAVTGFERVLALMFAGAMSVAGGFFNVARTEGLSGDSAHFYLLIGGMCGAAVAWSMLAVAIRFRARTVRLAAQAGAD
jgi:hypothetical protein